MSNEFAPLLPAVCDIARDAGAAIMKVYATDFAAERKADGTPVTEADTAAEAVILPALRSQTPDIPIISEENMVDGPAPDISGGRFWLVDPLDGTREFLKRNDEFTVNIGLIVDLEPVFGVLYAPALDTIYFGAGEGTAMRASGDGDPEPIRCRVATGPLVVVASRSHRDAATDEFLSRYEVAELVSAGSSLKFCRVAEGRADMYPRIGRTMEWDVAAGHAVLAAAGGTVETLDGEPLAYGKPGFDNPHFVARGR